jgi:hypothetical protein
VQSNGKNTWEQRDRVSRHPMWRIAQKPVDWYPSWTRPQHQRS